MGDASAPPGPAEREPEELLAEFAPLLRYDPQDQLRVISAESMVSNAGNVVLDGDGDTIGHSPPGSPTIGLDWLDDHKKRGKEAAGERLAQAPGWVGDARRMQADSRYSSVVYGRKVGAADGSAWLVYWLFYYYNPKNLKGFGKHEGDWEMIQVWVSPVGRPELVTYAQHEFGEARSWDEIESEGHHPVVYVGQLSHASYFERRSYPYAVKWSWLPLGIDHALGGEIRDQPEGPSETPRVEVLPDKGWPFWPGKWGTGERSVLGGMGDGPASPGCQELKRGGPQKFHSAQGRVPRAILRFAGRLIHFFGKLTSPLSPAVDSIKRAGGELTVTVSAPSRLLHRTKWVLLTVNQAGGAQLVLASRTVPKRKLPAQTFRVPATAGPLRVWASAFNGPRQRSDPSSAEVS